MAKCTCFAISWSFPCRLLHRCCEEKLGSCSSAESHAVSLVAHSEPHLHTHRSKSQQFHFIGKKNVKIMLYEKKSTGCLQTFKIQSAKFPVATILMKKLLFFNLYELNWASSVPSGNTVINFSVSALLNVKAGFSVFYLYTKLIIVKLDFYICWLQFTDAKHCVNRLGLGPPR